MPTIDDLTEVLDDRSRHLRQPPLAALHGRIRRRRRSRLAVTATALVAVLAVPATAVLVDARSHGEGVGDRGTTGAPAGPPKYLHGYELVDRRTATLPREASFSYTFTPTTYDFELVLWCDTDSTQFIQAHIGDRRAAEEICQPGGGVGNTLDTASFQSPQVRQQHWARLGVELHAPVQVTLTVRDGTVDPSRPAHAAGTAMLLRYQRVPFESYPLPPRPTPLPELSTLGTFIDPGATLLAIVDSSGPAAPRGSFEATVTRPPGTEVKLAVQAVGPGILRVLVGDVEVLRHEFWDWEGSSFSVPLSAVPDPSLDRLPVRVTVVAEHFTAPVWRVAVSAQVRWSHWD